MKEVKTPWIDERTRKSWSGSWEGCFLASLATRNSPTTSTWSLSLSLSAKLFLNSIFPSPFLSLSSPTMLCLWPHLHHQSLVLRGYPGRAYLSTAILLQSQGLEKANGILGLELTLAEGASIDQRRRGMFDFRAKSGRVSPRPTLKTFNWHFLPLVPTFWKMYWL